MNCRSISVPICTTAIALCLTTTIANGSAIYSFSGAITTSDTMGSAPGNLLNTGDTISGELTYSPEALSGGYLNDPANVEAAPILQASMSNGTASWGSEFGIDDLNDGSGFAGRNVVSGTLEEGGVDVANHDDGQAILAVPGLAEWTPPADYPADDFTLPGELNLDNFSGGEFQWEFFFPDFYEDTGDMLFIEGTIDQISRASSTPRPGSDAAASVSEPGSLALLTIGLVAFGRRMMRRD